MWHVVSRCAATKDGSQDRLLVRSSFWFLNFLVDSFKTIGINCDKNFCKKISEVFWIHVAIALEKKENCFRQEWARFLDKLDFIFQFETTCSYLSLNFLIQAVGFKPFLILEFFLLIPSKQLESIAIKVSARKFHRSSQFMLLSLEKKKENCLRHELARFLDKLDLIFQFATIR